MRPTFPHAIFSTNVRVHRDLWRRLRRHVRRVCGKHVARRSANSQSTARATMTPHPLSGTAAPSLHQASIAQPIPPAVGSSTPLTPGWMQVPARLRATEADRQHTLAFASQLAGRATKSLLRSRAATPPATHEASAPRSIAPVQSLESTQISPPIPTTPKPRSSSPSHQSHSSHP